MMNTENRQHRKLLQEVARQAMVDRGFWADFSKEVLAELEAIDGPATEIGTDVRDLRDLLWSSIDNDDSLDLDQLTVAKDCGDGAVNILVGIADVDALVAKQSAIDEHAQHNTTSIYTAAQIFPMLPEKLSTDVSSLNFDVDRRAMVVDMLLDADGSLKASDIYAAVVHNQCKLNYNEVAAWLDGEGPLPQALVGKDALQENLRLQDAAAQKMKDLRHRKGALDFETSQARPVFTGDELVALHDDRKNRAKEIIEEFMIAANGVSARFLTSRKYPSIRREVRRPKRWERIVDLAFEHGATLPQTPDSKALETFLTSARTADPLRFPDLSLSIIKLLGPGEYVVEAPEATDAGHFGLAVKEYTHSTAPNRRYPDLITQRLLKAAISGSPSPYDNDELEALTRHCTEAENAAKKVERQVSKSAAALLLEARVGEQFDAIVTGASAKGTWVRLLKMPIEGRLENGHPGVDVGQKVTVKLVGTDARRGFIDFRRS